MRWLALCSTPDAPGGDVDALAWLALSFTPRVARLEEAVVAEVSASLRLFGGARALRHKLQAEATQLGLALGSMAWAPSALAALALARCADTQPGRFSERLDALPLAALSAAHAHHAMLARLG
ncbi:MAG TPA: DNA polymerase Y family protein, partial [Roseateles sp.]